MGGESVDGDPVLDTDRGFARGRGAGDVDIISASGETFGQPFGEFRGTVDFGAYVSAGMRMRRFGVGRCADRIQLSSVSVMVPERRAFRR